MVDVFEISHIHRRFSPSFIRFLRVGLVFHTDRGLPSSLTVYHWLDRKIDPQGGLEINDSDSSEIFYDEISRVGF